MKKPLLILLCVPLIFSCGEKEKDNTENKEIENELIILEPSSPAVDVSSISVYITKDVHFYINEKRVDKSNLEQEIIEVANKIEDPEMILYTDFSVDIEHVVNVLDIASRNKFKLSIATEFLEPVFTIDESKQIIKESIEEMGKENEKEMSEDEKIMLEEFEKVINKQNESN
jgi:biopolymer transport protein ExbD